MKQNTSTILLICLTLCVANASWFGAIFNHTKLRGKLGLNTTNGLDIDYKGKLNFDNGYVAVDLVNFGAKFNAVPKPIENDANNKSVAYQGAFEIDHNGHKANAAVHGVIGVKSQSEAASNGGSHYTAGIAHFNKWNVTAADHVVDGVHIGLAKVKGDVHKNGSLITGEHKIHAYHGTYANVSVNGTHVGKGGITNLKKAHIESHFYLFGQNQSNSSNNEGHHGRPTGVGNANIQYEELTKLAWNNNTRAYTKNGQAGVDSVVWVNATHDGNDTAVRVKVAQNVDYQHHGAIYENGKKVANTMSVGDVAALKGVHFKANGEGFKGGVGSSGVWNHWSLGKKTGHNEKNSSNNDFLSENSEDLQDQSKNFGAKIKAQWAQYNAVNGSHSAENGKVVDVDSNLYYHIKADTDEHKKPYEAAGHKRVVGRYEVGNQADAVGDLTIKFDN